MRILGILVALVQLVLHYLGLAGAVLGVIAYVAGNGARGSELLVGGIGLLVLKYLIGVIYLLTATMFSSGSEPRNSGDDEIGFGRDGGGRRPGPMPPSRMDILSAYGRCLERDAGKAGSIFDISTLPCDKKRILDSICMQIVIEKDMEHLAALQVAAFRLADYQPGVGDRPISLLGIDPTAVDPRKLDQAGLVELARSIGCNPDRDSYEAYGPLVARDRSMIQSRIEEAVRIRSPIHSCRNELALIESGIDGRRKPIEDQETMEKVLLKDSEWRTIDGEACRVTEFVPFARMENGEVISVPKLPYASVHLESTKLPPNTVGYICHKMDFQHLWEAFNVRGVDQNEEVVIFWAKKHLKGFAKPFSAFMPGLWVTICKKGAYELITDPNCNPQLRGEERFIAERPIVDWKPEVIG